MTPVQVNADSDRQYHEEKFQQQADLNALGQVTAQQGGLAGSFANPAKMPSGRALLQNRAASFRYAADQIERLLGMTPAELTPEQEQALLFLGQNTQFVF